MVNDSVLALTKNIKLLFNRHEHRGTVSEERIATPSNDPQLRGVRHE